MENIKTFMAIDWLSFQVELDENICTNKDHVPQDGTTYKFECCTSTNVFEKRYICWDNHLRKMFTILFCPLSKMLKSNMGLLEIGNIFLYNGQLKEVIKVALNSFCCRITKISRLDVCCDFQRCYDEHGNTIEAKELARNLYTNSWYVTKKREGAVFFCNELDEDDKVITMPKQISWGNKKTEIKFKLYNKSLEIREESHKYYIQNLWKQCFDISSGDVWRCECSITHFSAYQFRIGEEQRVFIMDDIFDYDSVKMLFINMYLNRFVVRKNEGNKNKNRNTIVPIFGYNGLDNFAAKIKSQQNKPNDDVKAYINGVVKLVQSFYAQFYVTKATEKIKELKEFIDYFSYNEWFEVVYGCPIEEFKENIEENLKIKNY